MPRKTTKKNIYTISGYDEIKRPILAKFMDGIELDLDKLAKLDFKTSK